jgi:hypothetical protein
MNKEFFEKIFPSQGNVCIASIDKSGTIIPRFASDTDGALSLASKFIQTEANVYFTPGTYTGLRRKQEFCAYVKCFFLDIDVMHGKQRYDSKEIALSELQRFYTTIGWPEPVIVDSGGGIHAYWILNEEIPADDWMEYAEKLKQLCTDHSLVIDEGVVCDSARLMRIPGTKNYRYDPPMDSFITNEIKTHDIDVLLPAFSNVTVNNSFTLRDVEKGLDDDTKAIYEKRNKNFEYDFHDIVEASLSGSGCAQIKFIIENVQTCPEPLWYAGLSVAARCRDGAESIHLMSEGHPGYSYDATERKAAQSLKEATWAHGCKAFAKENAEGCDGCPHKGKIFSPIELGKVLKIAQQPTEPAPTKEVSKDEEDSPGIAPDTPKLLAFPQFLFPYARGEHGGIYFTPPPRRDKKGGMIQDPPERISPSDFYPVMRVFSSQDGECFVVKVYLPLDGCREFLLPLKDVTSIDRLKAILAHNGIVFNINDAPRIASYLMKWSEYLIEVQKAHIMRTQQGWSESYDGFLVGTNEITLGETRYCPPSPLAKNLVKSLKQTGDYKTWKESAQMFNDPGYELHAFTMLCGFASPLMQFTNVNGVAVSLYNTDSGVGKSGALYGALSAWGRPKPMSVYAGTPNGMIMRMVTSKNLPFGLDEQGNLDPKFVSSLIYNISSGKSKVRMMSSTNQEREQAFETFLISILTTNKPMRGLLYEHRADATAENLRLLELTMTKPSVKGYELTQERGLVMFDRFHEHNGFAGPDFIQKIMGYGVDNLQRDIRAKFLQVGDRYSINPEYRFLTNLIAVTSKTSEYLDKYDIVHFDTDRIFDVVGQEIEAIITGKRTEDENNYTDIIGDFISRNIQSCLVIREGKVTMEPRNSLFVRAEVDTGMIYISSSAMKEHLRKERMDVKGFEDRLRKFGVLQQKIKKQMAAGWKDAFGSTNVNAYELKLDISHIFNDSNQ